jgi:hypothetical protein
MLIIAYALDQVAAPGGEVIITNDGATILNKMTVTQPAAKMLVELAKSQVSTQYSPSRSQPQSTRHG